jgi:hypothetical protein
MHTLTHSHSAPRPGEFLLKAAKELEKEDAPRAQELYLQGEERCV